MSSAQAQTVDICQRSIRPRVPLLLFSLSLYPPTNLPADITVCDICLYGGGWAVHCVYECSKASRSFINVIHDRDVLQVKELKQRAERGVWRGWTNRRKLPRAGADG